MLVVLILVVLIKDRHIHNAVPERPLATANHRLLYLESRISLQVKASGTRQGQLQPMGLGPEEPLPTRGRVRELLFDNLNEVYPPPTGNDPR